MLQIFNVMITKGTTWVNLETWVPLVGSDEWHNCQRNTFNLGIMSRCQIQLYSQEGELLISRPWAAQVAVLVEKSPFSKSLQQTESGIELEGIGVAKINCKVASSTKSLSFKISHSLIPVSKISQSLKLTGHIGLLFPSKSIRSSCSSAYFEARFYTKWCSWGGHCQFSHSIVDMINEGLIILIFIDEVIDLYIKKSLYNSNLWSLLKINTLIY